MKRRAWRFAVICVAAMAVSACDEPRAPDISARSAADTSFELTCRGDSEVSLVIDYLSEAPRSGGQLAEAKAPVTPDGALADYFDIAQQLGSGFARSTFQAERTLDNGAVEFAVVVEGSTRVIATADQIRGDGAWGVIAIRGCESDMRTLLRI